MPNDSQCKNCQHVEYGLRTSPELWCDWHGEPAIKPCAQFSRCPGADDDEEVTK